MNKDTIYIESDNDITDILSKIKSSEKKIVALVPPKRPTVLMSSVNIRLIARAARAEKKAIVLVTTDDALIKLAMTAKLPVASSLKSRPIMPEAAETFSGSEKTPENNSETPSEKNSEKSSASDADAATMKPSEEDIDPEVLLEETSDSSDNSKKESGTTAETSKNAESSAQDSEEKSEKKALSSSKKAKSEKLKKEYGNPVIAFLNEKKAWVIFGIIALALVIVFFVWALMIAPKLGLIVKVRTSSGNFSENINLTTSAIDEKSSEGVFYAHEETLEKSQEIKFTATGQKDLGEPASGSLVVYYTGKKEFSYDFSSGAVFTYKNLEYIATTGTTLSWDGDDDSVCGQGSSIRNGCVVSATISVKASAPGENYNVSGEQTGWASRDFPEEVSVYNSTDISGGTSKIVTIVQQSDVDLALDKLANDSKESGKNELLSKLSETVLPLDASFVVEATEPKSSPAAGEEVPEGVTPTVSSKTTYKILTLDRARLEEFINLKANLEENRKIYSVGDPFVEYFTQTGDGTYSGKLKTTYKFGPRLSETEILERIDGQKVGRIEPILRDSFPGISSVTLEKSVFWVNKVPKNPNRVTIKLEVED